jgi:phosphopantetheinyl transferase
VGSIQLSLSHSGAYAAFAFSRYSSLGVGIEKVREIPEIEGIVESHFNAHDKQLITSSLNKMAVFYRV